MWDVHTDWFKRGFRLRSALWVACIMLPSGRMTWGLLLIFLLLLHGVFNLMYFCVDPVSAMPYCSRLVGGLPLHLVLVLLKFAKCSKLSSSLVKFKLLVGYPNHQRPCVRPKVLPTNIVVALDSALCPSLLFLQYSPGCTPAPWLQQYVVFRQLGWWDCTSFSHLGTIIPLYVLAAPAPPEWPNFLRLYI